MNKYLEKIAEQKRRTASERVSNVTGGLLGLAAANNLVAMPVVNHYSLPNGSLRRALVAAPILATGLVGGAAIANKVYHSVVENQ